MVRIVSANVRGLRDNQKRREVFLKYKDVCDILCLQETHCTNEDLNMWQNEWGGEIYASNHNSQSRGVMILIKKNIPITCENICTDMHGRYIIVNFKHNEEWFLLANLYGPNKDSPDFLTEVFHEVDKHTGLRLIVGDFNVALDEEKDRYRAENVKPVARNIASRNVILQYMLDTELTDVWRVRNPEKKIFTWKRNKPYTASRIDLVLSDIAVSHWIKDIYMKEGYKSDHKYLLCDLVPHLAARGSGVWKLNNSLLTNPELVEIINTQIDEALRLGNGLTSQELWETIKCNCISACKEFASINACCKRVALSQLEEILEKLEVDENSSSLYNKTKADRDQIIKERTESAMFRSKAQWYGEGEKPTKYFLNLEKRRSGAKNMTSLLTEADKVEINPGKDPGGTAGLLSGAL